MAEGLRKARLLRSREQEAKLVVEYLTASIIRETVENSSLELRRGRRVLQLLFGKVEIGDHLVIEFPPTRQPVTGQDDVIREGTVFAQRGAPAVEIALAQE